MKKDAVFIYSEDQLNYSFSDTHPFNQKRIILRLDLLKTGLKEFIERNARYAVNLDY